MEPELTLEVRTEFAPRLFDIPAHRLYQELRGPTLFDLSNRYPASFVSVLLHGDEMSGWDAIREYLSQKDLPESQRSLVLFVGNVAAAAKGLRSLPGQQDYNRIWNGGDSPEHHVAHEVINYVAETRPVVALDLHNNSTPNPHYSVLTDFSKPCVGYAARFSPLVLLATEVDEIIIRAMNDICPAVTLEAGMPSDRHSVQRLIDILRDICSMESAPDVNYDDLTILKSEARVFIECDQSSLDPGSVRLNQDLESMNFSRVPAGTQIARISSSGTSLKVFDMSHRDISKETFLRQEDTILLKHDVMIAMYTSNLEAAIQDCVCYFLEPTELA